MQCMINLSCVLADLLLTLQAIHLFVDLFIRGSEDGVKEDILEEFVKMNSKIHI